MVEVNQDLYRFRSPKQELRRARSILGAFAGHKYPVGVWAIVYHSR